ncbi:hypothetical protein BCV69DRAFT_281243 [Microstroma glucosiphilum]|uniref:Ferritin-like domain-containing protein n=1 Tax=Pseudomicrostroma glucosiphilum TaxID=1684307 RepID=A0A316UCY4_9BASI|nr:hypothetical protein BCV69DRAFT_281243 [Pseudomicrostroma glucosiphilum]PWN22233.1 hypothetical protein BCV69DRAFT_281243 [Pseudomicrostroma glucosiphilum]
MVSVKFASLFAFVAASMVAAAPAALKKRADIDTTILQYALTLEHLEAKFYHTALKNLSAKDFANAGYAPAIRERFAEIGGHEIQHVQFLEAAIGADANKACTYDFGAGVTDVKSFIATSQLLEGVGVSAYLGAAALITNPTYLTAAGSILTTESRHSAWVQSSAALSDPAGAAYDVPTNFNQTYSLAAPLIKSCPKSNTALPVMAFPTLTLNPASNLQPGQTVSVSGKGVKDGQYLAVLTAGGQYFSKIENGKATVPKKTSTGRSYFLVTSSNGTVSDDSTIAGPVASDYLLSASQAYDLVKSQY